MMGLQKYHQQMKQESLKRYEELEVSTKQSYFTGKQIESALRLLNKRG